MKNNLSLAIFIAVLVVAFLIFYKKPTTSTEEAVMGVKTKSTMGVTQPTTKPILKDDSFASIETDLSNTIILNEDFSDL